VTRWRAANLAVAQDPAGNLKPAKDKSTERIDGIVALIMAIGRAMIAKEHVPATPMPPLSGAPSPTRRPGHAAGAWALGSIPGRIRRSE
jgi:phage terminase large subunit-like protein